MNTTNTAQFTPGPWKAILGEHLNSDVCHINAQGERVFVAEFATQADACLGAAAPAMYAIIKDMREAFYVKGTRKALLEVMERSKDVLAQAEGRHHE